MATICGSSSRADAALGQRGSAAIEPTSSKAVGPAGWHTKTTVAGTVSITCAGDVIGAQKVTPAAGWDAGDTTGDNRKGETGFTTDRPTAHGSGQDGGDTLIVSYRCDTGKADWDTRYE